MRIRTWIIAIVTLSALSSCEGFLIEDDPENTNRSNFEYLWKECDEKYSFFEYKGIDWDAVYQRYSPRVNNNISQDSFFRVMFAMLNELRDGHVNLISPFNVSRYEISLLGPQNIDERLVLEAYLGADYYSTGPFRHNFLADRRIGYVRYSSFANRVSEFDMNFILARYRQTQGIILDIRQNGGGSVSNVFTILNRFAAEKTLLYRSFLKSGPGREDFSGPIEAYAEPPEDKDFLRYSRKVIVLTDRGSYSAASFFSLGAKALPNMMLMGDTTGGGLGIPNGGQMPNGWTYRFSISRTFTPDGANYEDGVPPDIRVILQPSDIARRKDTVIERAIEEILR